MHFAPEAWDALKDGITLLRAKKDGAKYIISGAFKDAKTRAVHRVKIIVSQFADDGRVNQDIGNMVAFVSLRPTMPRWLRRKHSHIAKINAAGDLQLFSDGVRMPDNSAKFEQIVLG